MYSLDNDLRASGFTKELENQFEQVNIHFWTCSFPLNTNRSRIRPRYFLDIRNNTIKKTR